MLIIELKRIASIKNIKYHGIMPKDKLIEMLEANDKDPSVILDHELAKKYKEMNKEKWDKKTEKYREKSRQQYREKKAKKSWEMQSK